MIRTKRSSGLLLLLLTYSFIIILTFLPRSTLAQQPTPTADFVLPTTPANAGTSQGRNNATSGNSTISLLDCPPPLVPNLNNLATDSCMGKCCLPCPVSNLFYEPNQLENIYSITTIIRAMSALACLILVICYLILPSRHKHPHLIVLIFATVMVPWEALGTAWWFKKDELLCKSVYENTTMYNSLLCAVQGVLLMYLVLVIMCLGLILITNLHLLTVYRSSAVQSHLTKLIILTFFLPLILVIPVTLQGQIEYPGFGSICFVGTRAAGKLFFYPLAAIVSLASLIHLGTIAFMIKTAINANTASSISASASTSDNPLSEDVKIMTPRQRRLQTARDITLLLKQQWRPGLLALFLLFIDMIFWLFFFLEAVKLREISPTTPWFKDWIACLGQQMTLSMQADRLSLNSGPNQIQLAGQVAQKACAAMAAPFVPNFAWAALSDILPATFGVVILIIFGSRIELWVDLREKLFGTREKTTFAMEDIPPGERGSHSRNIPPQGHGRTRSGRAYSQDSDVDGLAYSSRVGLSSLPEDRVASTALKAKNSSTALIGATMSYGGPTRKTSVTIAEDDREPIYYRNPDLVQQSSALNSNGPLVPNPVMNQDTFHLNRARMTTEGSDDWPTWPLTRNPRPTTSDSTPSKNKQSFYNSDDIDAPPAMLSKARPSNFASPTATPVPTTAAYANHAQYATPIPISHPSRSLSPAPARPRKSLERHRP